MNIKTCLLLFLWMVISAQPILARNHPITLLEKQTDDPVHNAHISWKSLDNSDENGFGITNEKGVAIIPGAAGGKVVVNISSVGYKTLQDTINLQSTSTLHLDVDVLNLDQIVVTGTRTPKRLADVPVQTMVIPEIDIRRAGTVSPLEILKDNVPGLVTSSNAMGNNLRIRGLNSRYILFLVDGERLVSEGSGGISISIRSILIPLNGSRWSTEQHRHSMDLMQWARSLTLSPKHLQTKWKEA